MKMDNEIRKYCESCKFYSVLGCQSTLICRDGNRFIAVDVQSVNAKEILRHLDSMMICIGNAYDTSHGLLRSDMEFIEKQEKIIKELLEGAGK